MICYLCDKSDFVKVYSLPDKNILRCKNDGLFLESATAAVKTEVYGEDYYSNEPNKFNQKYFIHKLLTIKQLTNNKSPKILDLGCGWGDFEEVLEKEKIPYLGIDINKEAIAVCKKKGLNCKLSTIQQLTNNNKKLYDAITLLQVIEHLKNPLPILKAAKKLLKPGGIILITTPNNDSPLRKLMGARWSIYTEPSHYLFFNRSTLKKTLELTELRNIEVKIDTPRFLSSTYILNLLLNANYKLPSFPIPTDPFGDLQAIAIK